MTAAPAEEAPHGPAGYPAAAAAPLDREITEGTAFTLVVKTEPVAVAVIPRRVKTATLMGLATVVTEGTAETIAQYSAPLTG
jgi:hypothetical protein